MTVPPPPTTATTTATADREATDVMTGENDRGSGRRRLYGADPRPARVHSHRRRRVRDAPSIDELPRRRRRPPRRRPPARPDALSVLRGRLLLPGTLRSSRRPDFQELSVSAAAFGRAGPGPDARGLGGDPGGRSPGPLPDRDPPDYSGDHPAAAGARLWHRGPPSVRAAGPGPGDGPPAPAGHPGGRSAAPVRPQG